ncbi:MAG: hypothetical protein P4L62_00835 [Candidatus Pacebacteria bacterium]|nr:hypothetical protein [Candidatus Paceibacterota bacterium]MDR3582894.1 hypothetical protein [Candidatus Paceibacterota bacterium]
MSKPQCLRESPKGGCGAAISHQRVEYDRMRALFDRGNLPKCQPVDFFENTFFKGGYMNGFDLVCEIVLRQEIQQINLTLSQKIPLAKRARCYLRKAELEEKIKFYNELSLVEQAMDSII